MRLAASAMVLAATCCAAALPPHPRLVLTPERRANLTATLASGDTVAQSFFSTTLAQAQYWATQRVPGPSSPSGSPNAREVLQSLYSLGLAGVFSGNATLTKLAAEWVLNAAASPEWDTNGTAQLNTGEMMHVVGFGLDWLYDELSAEQRAALVNALVTTGLARVHGAFTNGCCGAGAFLSTDSNWNSVILGGTVIGFLAVLGEPGVPAWVGDELLPAALANLRQWSASAWDPAGAWPEGPNYGGYAARYLAPTVSALLTATGGDGGLLTPGALASPRYLLSLMGPNLEYFYYYDTRDLPETVSQYLAFAALAGDAPAAAGVKALVAALAPSVPVGATSNNVMNAPVALLYYTPLGGNSSGEYATLPRVARFPEVQVVTARSSWTGAPAGVGAPTFVGFKGRNTTTQWAHTHLDGGTWVYQREGSWLVQDLGSDSYAAPGYFSKDRFKLYRTGSLGHNTLTFGGANQFCVVEGTYSCNCSEVPLLSFNVTPAAEAGAATASRTAAAPVTVDAWGVMDLTGAYRYLNIGLARAQRGIVVADGVQSLVIVDEVEFGAAAAAGAAAPPPLWWSAHTVANVSVASDGLTATLSAWNVTTPVHLAVVAASTTCPGAAFTVVPVDLQPPMVPTPGVSRVTLVAPAATCSRLTVAVGPDASAGMPLNVAPLARWAADGPLA